MSHVSDFLHLFRGNALVVGMDNALGLDAPGPVRLEPDQAADQWPALVESHLAGYEGIGVYPMNDVHRGVAWGCVDLDEGELASWSYALLLRAALYELGVTAWIERSRSKGYHVWVFSGGWIPAKFMRQLLLGACQAVGVPSKEVNPKSPKLQPGQLGNFVRLPYKGVGKAASTPHITRQVVVDLNGQPLSLLLFLSEALEHASDPKEVVALAKTLIVPREPIVQGAVRYTQGLWQEQLNALARKQLEEGPKPDADRSSFLAAFSHACWESGLAAEDVEQAIRLADRMHCHKYEHRNDGDARYAELVDLGKFPTDRTGDDDG